MSERLALLGGRATAWEQDWPYVDEDEESAVLELIRSRTLSIYDRSGVIEALEDEFLAYHGDEAPRFALTQNSGTSALTSCYFGLGVMPGDEVIVPTYTFLATVTPLLLFGAVPVFADLEPDTLTIDPAHVEQLIGPRTVGVVATHIWGHPADVERLSTLVGERGLFLLEDCSHAHGATLKGRKVGTFGHAAAFSLEGHKAVAAGEGGILLTRDRVVYERALMLGHFGRRIKDEILEPSLRAFVETGFGQKYRMHPMAAAIARVQLRRLDARNERRRMNLERLSRLLQAAHGVKAPVTREGCFRGGWYGYKPIFVPEEMPDIDIVKYIEALRAEGVLVKRPGSPPLHHLPLFNLSDESRHTLRLPWRTGASQQISAACPNADKIYPLLLSLPTFSGECDEVIDQYGAAFSKISDGYDQLVALGDLQQDE
jgi:perosamine synthetase